VRYVEKEILDQQPDSLAQVELLAAELASFPHGERGKTTRYLLGERA